MKKYWKSAAGLVLAGPLLFTACKKSDNGELSGPAPQPTFSVVTKQVGLTTQATFTNTTAYTGPGIVFYEWDFGDGSTVSSTTPTITHVYSKGGTVQAQLLASASGGNGFSAKQNIVLPDVGTLVKQLLTNGTTKTWLLNDTISVITVGPSDSDVTSYYSGNTKVNQSPACQVDDEYTFSNAGVLTYDAKGQTFVAGGNCDTPRNYTVNYTFGPAVGTGLAQFDLQSTATGAARPFIGVTDAPDLTYRIMRISANRMTVRAGKSTGNLVFEMKFKAK
ncbi:PKD domain-containing protein [Hymenobacter sp. UV11]|uniref:PKD domain-containing protein n=1 Tax=Hymenobacter sp. UV11 TaxID=1849735 RepID=UPI001060B04F|nr:PKD domain-containing protein [Hymenobacter sp. UV11]TDN38029.1 hypothetical protein A8B98_00635 [Hymenobacter sp. UV11]TFZ64644.1 PKD domain-containing protein [Hymenobacter sp. UV11]